MIRRIAGTVDPYVAALLTTVAIASFLPCRGAGATFFGWATDAAIVLLFFLHGAKLSWGAIVAGALAWRLHLFVMSITFLLFPIIGLCAARLAVPMVGPSIAAGILFLTLLPSTVQSSIAFTAIAGGNVPAAVCSASFSNLAGIFITPLLVAVMLHPEGAGRGGGGAFASVQAIALQLLLPFLLGHLSRRWTAGFIQRHKQLTTIVDRGSILLVVYTAFSAAVVEGLWHIVSASTLIAIVGVSLAILLTALACSFALGGVSNMPRADRIVLIFCGSKKSLASGVPMAGVLFPAAMVGSVILPLMIFHQLQLIACAFIARKFAARTAADGLAHAIPTSITSG
jgi:sodium/bile acid cotransporter 7